MTLGYPCMDQMIHIQQDVGDDDEMYHVKEIESDQKKMDYDFY